MLFHAKKFVYDIRSKIYYPLTYCGPTEIGKTHLLDRCYVLLNKLDIEYRYKATSSPKVLMDSWKTISRKLFNRETSEQLLFDIERCGVLIISEFLSQDFSAPNNYNTIIVEFAHEVLDLRAKKPILLDTNKSLQEIEAIDKRIASRLNRYGGIFLNINPETPNYLSRCS